MTNGEGLIEAVALAMAKEIGWGTFSHFDPNDMRRVAKAAISAMPEATALSEQAKRIEVLEERISKLEDEVVTLWHQAEGEDRSLSECLGMTQDQYAAWVVSLHECPALKSGA